MRDDLMPVFRESLAMADKPCPHSDGPHHWFPIGYDKNGLLAMYGSRFDTSDGRLQSCANACGAKREVSK